MIGRVYTNAHWQTDVLTGFGVGFLAGWFATTYDTPFVLLPFDNGIYVGFNQSF